MDCHDFEEIAGAYALGAITKEERQAADEHLAHCVSCQRILQEMQSAVDILPLSVPQVEPSAQLKARIFGAVLAETPQWKTQVQQPLGAARQIRRRSWWQYWEARLVTTVAALLLILVGGMATWNISLQQQVNQLSAASLPTITYAIRSTSAATDATGQVIYFPRLHMTTLLIRGLPPLSGSQIYEGWLIKNNHPQSIGLLNVQDGTAALNFPGDVRSYDTLAISAEPGPKASRDAPKGPIVAVGPLQHSQQSIGWREDAYIQKG